MSQWYNKRMLGIDERGTRRENDRHAARRLRPVLRRRHVLRVNTDDEESPDYFLTRVSVNGGAARYEDLARVPFAARGLAYDGSRFWTNHREHNQIVAFTVRAGLDEVGLAVLGVDEMPDSRENEDRPETDCR